MQFADANYAKSAELKPTSGAVYIVFGLLITCSFRKQDSVVLSTCEAKYMAAMVTLKISCGFNNS